MSGDARDKDRASNSKGGPLNSGAAGGPPDGAAEKAKYKYKYKEYKSLFEKYDIDPRQGPRGITERLRELAEDATAEAERAEIRAAWEELTLHPIRRLRAAFGAHPETRPPIGVPPPLGGASSSHKYKKADAELELTLSELLVRPSVARALGGGASVLGPPRDGQRPIPGALSRDENLEDDPILKRVPDVR